VALQQQRGTPTTRSSVGSVTTLSNLLRMLYSRAGTYPRGAARLEAEAFSPNTPAGACPRCHGLGRLYDVTEASMVPDPSLTIRERAVAAWPPAWHGQNLRDMLVTLGYDIDTPWKKLPRKQRDWILFTEEQPVVPVYPGYEPHEVKRAQKRKEEPNYHGNFSSARRFVLETFANTESALMKKRASKYLVNAECADCGGQRLRREALAVTFEGRSIAETSRLSLKELHSLLCRQTTGSAVDDDAHPERALVVHQIASDFVARLKVLLDLGLGYLSLDRGTPTLSPGELQRLRLATQVRSNLFGVVYVLDEPSAGLHPADTEALLTALDGLKASGNTLFVVEHELDVIRHADWIVDVGPLAGQHGGEIVYSGPLPGLSSVASSRTARHLFGRVPLPPRTARSATGRLVLTAVKRNNLDGLDVQIPLGVFVAVSGVSGSGKSSLVSQVLVELVSRELGAAVPPEDDEGEALERAPVVPSGGVVVGGLSGIKRLVRVDQKPIGRTPRSNLATYTGLFDPVRKLFARTKTARARRYDAGHFSFNVAKGRCQTCAGEGSVMVELLFLPSVYAPCPTCHGARYDEKTLQVRYRDRNIAEVLSLTVDAAVGFFQGDDAVVHPLRVLRDVGLGYLRLGQPATELSGGEAQRIKLATELQRPQRGDTLYVLDEPTTGLHPEDVERLMVQLDGLVDAGNTVIVVEHDMRVIAGSDWVMDLGPGAGDEGGEIVFAGTPAELCAVRRSRTAPYLSRFMRSAGTIARA
jgi:excinuclease ABC subunit A